MNRRLLGALLLVAVLTLALVIPTLDGRRSAGTATMIERPRDPQVGECLLPTATDSPGTYGGSPASLASTSADCEGRSVAGEVVAVAGEMTDVTARPDNASDGGLDCRRLVMRYSGLQLQDGRPLSSELFPNDPISWDLALNVRSALLVPSPILRSAGQDWRACVATPVGDEPYVGRLTDAFAGGRLPNEFGVCSAKDGPGGFLEPVPCGSPHIAELVATATVPGNATTAEDIQQSCVRIVGVAIGRPDPTGSGELSVGTSFSPDAAQFLARYQPLDVSCYVSSTTRPLAGTLVGLGEQPIPFHS